MPPWHRGVPVRRRPPDQVSLQYAPAHRDGSGRIGDHTRPQLRERCRQPYLVRNGGAAHVVLRNVSVGKYRSRRLEVLHRRPSLDQPTAFQRPGEVSTIWTAKIATHSPAYYIAIELRERPQRIRQSEGCSLWPGQLGEFNQHFSRIIDAENTIERAVVEFSHRLLGEVVQPHPARLPGRNSVALFGTGITDRRPNPYRDPCQGTVVSTIPSCES